MDESKQMEEEKVQQAEQDAFTDEEEEIEGQPPKKKIRLDPEVKIAKSPPMWSKKILTIDWLFFWSAIDCK